MSRQWPEVMRVLLTGQAGLASAIYAINNAGLHRYVEKPWEAEDIAEALSDAAWRAKDAGPPRRRRRRRRRRCR